MSLRLATALGGAKKKCLHWLFFSHPIVCSMRALMPKFYIGAIPIRIRAASWLFCFFSLLVASFFLFSGTEESTWFESLVFGLSIMIYNGNHRCWKKWEKVSASEKTYAVKSLNGHENFFHSYLIGWGYFIQNSSYGYKQYENNCENLKWYFFNIGHHVISHLSNLKL